MYVEDSSKKYTRWKFMNEYRFSVTHFSIFAFRKLILSQKENNPKKVVILLLQMNSTKAIDFG